MKDSYSDRMLARLEDLVNNPTARIPICLCLDTSASMEGKPISELNKGIKKFYQAIHEDETAVYSAEISIVTFGDHGVRKISDFESIEQNPNPPATLHADGGTPLGEALNLALDLLERRKKEYKDYGVDYYQPWLVIMTDGCSNGSKEELDRAIRRTTEMVNNRKLTIFPIAIGSAADRGTLQKISPNRSPLTLKNLMFNEFFAWLSQSVSRTSQSIPGTPVPIDINEIKGWSSL